MNRNEIRPPNSQIVLIQQSATSIQNGHSQRGFRRISTRLAFWILLIALSWSVPLTLYEHLATKKAVTSEASKKGRYLVELAMERINKRRQIVESKTRVLAATLNEWKINETTEETILSRIQSLIRSNADIFGSAVAFEPSTFSPGMEAFAPYFSRQENESDELRFTDLASETYNYSSKAWYRQAIDSGVSIWSEPYFDEGGGDTLMTTYSVPFFSVESTAAGVVTADMSLDHLKEIVRSLDIEESSYCFITSAGGELLFHPLEIRGRSLMEFALENQSSDLAEAARRLAADDGKGGFMRYSESIVTREEGIIAYRKDQRSGWGVALVLNRGELLAESTRLLWIRLITACLLIVSLIVTVLLVSRRVTRPLRLLAEETEKFAAGNFRAKGLETTRPDEIGLLSRSFEKMGHSLNHYIDELTTSTAARQKIESELEIAHQIQLRMVPERGHASVSKSGFAIAARLIPARAVGGDWYDYRIFDDQRVFFCVGDVSDKGIPAALLMSEAITTIRGAVQERQSITEVLQNLNKAFCNENDACMFATVLCGELDVSTGELKMVSAGHTSPIVASASSSRFVELSRGLPIGLDPDAQYEVTAVQLQTGDCLVAYSDGVTEAFDQGAVPYGEERLLNSAKSQSATRSQSLAEGILDDVREFTDGAPQSDDISLLVIHTF